MPENPDNKFGQSPGGLLNDQVGGVIASAATIAPTHKVHHVSGTTAIVNITVPHEGFCGPIFLIADAVWSWTAAGNIAVVPAATVVVGRAYPFVYDRKAAKWYPVN